MELANFIDLKQGGKQNGVFFSKETRNCLLIGLSREEKATLSRNVEFIFKIIVVIYMFDCIYYNVYNTYIMYSAQYTNLFLSQELTK